LEISQKDIQEQVNEARSGRQAAFSFLLDHFWNQVFGFQLKRVQDEYEAEDIAIETFARAFDKIDTYKDDFSFGTWLVTISKNIQIDRNRKKNASVHRGATSTHEEHIKRIADIAPTPEDKLITDQHLAELLRYIKQLKPHYQEVINLRYFQELSYAAIAEELDQPLSTVKVRLLRAKKLLAEIITANKET
jgi:RNA polymerase sigma-70 factor (ECF subfamily)